MGQVIFDVKVHWSWVEEEGHFKNRRYYPQDLEITFENEIKIYFSAFEVRSGGFQMGMIDHITIFFDEAVAREFRIGPYA